MKKFALWERKRGIRAIALALFLLFCGQFLSFGVRSENLSEKVLRFHILANSDTKEDQAIKLQVRDRILQEAAGLLDSVDSPLQAEEVLREKLPSLLQSARETVQNCGKEQEISGGFCTEYFPTRTYTDREGKTYTLPAGTYRSLTIRIGEAEGHNWWCVMFPSLCLPAAMDFEGLAEESEGYFTDEELYILENHSEYEVRFYFAELFDKLLNNVEC